ncbi:MAG: hypothetical protein MI919_12465 [Holophagales bacterium]|nr:hypothetical protein [Holophagales bacterium]
MLAIPQPSAPYPPIRDLRFPTAARAPRLPAFLCLILSLLLATSEPSRAQETQINTTISGSQIGAQVARLPDGSSVSVWVGDAAILSTENVIARRLDASGDPIGEELQINTVSGVSVHETGISALQSGGFVVVWSGADGGSSFVNARLFDSAGVAVGTELGLDSGADTVIRGGSDVAPAGSGFAVVWARDEAGPDGAVRFRRFDSAGTALGTELQLSTAQADLSDYRVSPTIVELADGRFLTAWASKSSGGGDTDGSSIQARFVDAAGNASASPFQVNSFTTGQQRVPTLAQAGDGTLLVAWQSEAIDSDDDGISGQLLDSAGNFLGAELRLNHYQLGSQTEPSASAVGSGFFAAWRSNSVQKPEWELSGRYFDTGGVALGPERPVAQLGYSPDLVTTAGGRPVAVYQRFDSGQGWDVYTSVVPPFLLDATSLAVGNECQGAQVVFEVDLLHDGGPFVADPVTLSSPDFAGVSFDANPVTPQTTVSMTVDTTSTFEATFRLLGSDPTGQVETAVGYSVIRNPPDPPQVLLPENGAVDLPIRPILTWLPFYRLDSMNVEIATEPSFADVVSAFVAPSASPPKRLPVGCW